MESDRKHLAILFADIGGSTRLYDTLGDVEARRITAECVDRIIDAVRVSRGSVIKTIGDEVMCAFDDPNAAVDAARAILAAVEAGADSGIGVHVGLHFGPVVEEKDDVFGDTVNVAARMVGLARDGEIVTTRQVVDRLTPDRAAATRQIDRRAVKGKEGMIEIYTVSLPADGKLTALNFAIFDDAPREETTRLVLRLPDLVITLDASRPRVTIGRQVESDIVLTDVGVSRQHAVVEQRHGKFYLIDASTNGTVLLMQDQTPTFLRREEAILIGSGRFGLSRYPEVEPPTAIHFELQTGSA